MPPPRTMTRGPVVDIVWEDPPARSGPGGPNLLERVQPLLEELELKPDTWARIVTYTSTSGAGSGRKSLEKLGLPKTFELVGRRHQGGSAIWARFVGDA